MEKKKEKVLNDKKEGINKNNNISDNNISKGDNLKENNLKENNLKEDNLKEDNTLKEEKETFDINILKKEIRDFVKNEQCLKSISFSYNDVVIKKEFICYFAWQQTFYSKYFKERDSIRNNVIKYLEKYNFRLNKKISTAAKYVFELSRKN